MVESTEVVALPARAMTPAELPDNESQRLAALLALQLLDTPPEARFDRIVAFAAQEFDVPIALMSLVDTDRQWFKARVGLQVSSTGRSESFCAHAILQPGIFVVPDAQADRRFADNPLVTGDPQVRFYAGAPLELATGERIGTLCLIDRAPRRFDALDEAILKTLRQMVVDALQANGGHA